MSKTLSLHSIIPSISSVTKSDSPSAPVRKKFKTKFSLSGFTAPLSAVALLALVLSLGFYVYMINAYASKGYDLKHQQASMEDVLETNKRLVIQQAALGSIVKVNDVAATSGMVPVTGEEFLSANHVSSR